MAVYFPQEIPGILKKHKRSIFENVAHVFQESGVRRSSRLCAPVERIEDYPGEVFCVKFHPHGELLMSAGIRTDIHICSVYGKEGSVMILRGHWGAVMEAHFSTDGTHIYSCSQDESLGVWDTFTGIRISDLRGHSGCINTLQVARRSLPILCSGGDDSTLRMWDVRQLFNTLTIDNKDQVTAACFDETADHIFTGGVETDIKIWDVRMCDIVLRLHGHKDAVTGVSLSPCGSYLLSNSVDNTLRVWDIRPSYTGERCIRVFDSCQYIVNGNLFRCAWSPDGHLVSSGSCEEGVPLFNVVRGVKMNELPGHEGTINDVDFHPTEPIIASASGDSHVFLREIIA